MVTRQVYNLFQEPVEQPPLDFSIAEEKNQTVLRTKQVFKCHLNAGQPDHYNTRQMDTILLTYVLVQYSNGQSSIYDKPTI